MVVGRGVEVQLRVRDRLAAVVVVQHVLQVADPHVVGLDREIRPPEVLLGDLEVANGRGERLARVEAVVDLGALALQAGDQRELPLSGRLVDLPGQLPAAREVDVHPEQRLAGLGQDLGQPRGIRRDRARRSRSAGRRSRRTRAPRGCSGRCSSPRRPGRSGPATPPPAPPWPAAPPGLLTYRTCALPAIARATKSDSRSGTYANGSPGLAGCPIPGSGSGGGPLLPPEVAIAIAPAIRASEYDARNCEASAARGPAPGPHGVMSRGRRGPSCCTPPGAPGPRGSGTPSSHRRRSGRR